MGICYCKDCSVWKNSKLSINVEHSELRYCSIEKTVKFSHDTQCKDACDEMQSNN